MFPGFEHPFTCVVAGPTQSGKTVFVQNILKGSHLYISPPPQKIVWCYGIQNEAQMQQTKAMSNIPIEFFEGIPPLDMLSPNERTVIILDDLMEVAGKNKHVADLFTRGCHHRNASVFLLIQNLYHRGSKMRDIHTSCQYLFTAYNPRDSSFIQFLEKQCFPQWKNYLRQAYAHACRLPFGMLGIDFRQATPNERRVFSGCFPYQTFFYYRPTNWNF
jgi:hypothetical protein